MRRRPRLRFQDARRTTTFRLSAMFGLTFAVAVVALLGLVYVRTARELTLRSDAILRHEADALLRVSDEALPARVRAEIANPSYLNSLALFANNGERVTGNIALPPGIVIGRPVDAPGPIQGRPARLLAVRTPAGETILVGRDTSQIADLRRTILRILFGSGAAIAVLVLAAGVALSLDPLRRVRDLADVGRAIGRGDLHRRMPIAGRRDELDLFAGTVNTMIDEVERVIGQVKGVTDAVAHDLRSPLARVRARMDRVARDGETPPGLREAAAGAVADLDLVLDRFAALLRISELEAGARAGFAATDLGAIVTGAAELYEPLAEERGQRLTTDIPMSATALADGKLLFEAVSNLIDNAIKFTPEGGNIAVGIAPGPCVYVRDDGPGVAAHETEAVLRRFARGRESADVPGSGLGLSVVAAIAHLHRFTLSLEDARPGLLVRLCCYEMEKLT